jgi:hypothetical protein
LDSDWKIGTFVTFAGCTNSANNGTFSIVNVNQSGFPSIVVSNASGVAQTSAAGTADLCLWSYNYSNPVDSDFAVGEVALFASHTNESKNGSFTIHKINEAGNNVWVYNQNGAAQASPAGTLNTERWIFAYSAAVNTNEYVAGERALMASHTNAANNGNKLIIEVNRSGNNLIIYNPGGVVQGGAAGNATTNRWRYVLNTNPSSQVSVGDKVSFEGHTNAANNGIFEIKIVNNSGNDLVIYNEAGVAQGSAAGAPRHTRKLVKFGSDQSSVFTTDSYFEMTGTVSGLYRATPNREQFKVLEVNRGGGANYNVVIDGGNAPSQASPAGFVSLEAKSIFIVPPSIPVDVTAEEPNKVLKIQSSNFVAGSISTNTPVMLYILEVPLGDPEDLTVILA